MEGKSKMLDSKGSVDSCCEVQRRDSMPIASRPMALLGKLHIMYEQLAFPAEYPDDNWAVHFSTATALAAGFTASSPEGPLLSRCS